LLSDQRNILTQKGKQEEHTKIEVEEERKGPTEGRSGMAGIVCLDLL
jgi:hypothetical protein